MTMIDVIGLIGGGALCAAVIWSLLVPSRRIWPPARVTGVGFVLTWGATGALFGAVIALGVVGWGTADLPLWLRAIGALILVPAHVLLWPQVLRFGIAKTSGAGNGLETQGLYAHLRNPQYAGDILLLLGWSLLCAAPAVWPLALAGIIALALAPLSEEPWLRARYGAKFDDYCAQVPRWGLGR